MEIFLDIITQGNLKIELSVNKGHGCSVIFTVNDDDDRRVLRSTIMDKGRIKIYSTAEEAIKDAIRKLTPHAAED